MPEVRFRIRDLLTGRTLITATRGRDLVAYHREHYRPGYCDWLWQYEQRPGEWSEIPRRVLRTWKQRGA